MFRAGGNDINAGGVNTAVTEDVGKLGDVLFNTVKGTCEQVTKIMRKYLLRIYSRLLAKAFHFSPNIRAAHWLTVAGNEYCTR